MRRYTTTFINVFLNIIFYKTRFNVFFTFSTFFFIFRTLNSQCENNGNYFLFKTFRYEKNKKVKVLPVK